MSPNVEAMDTAVHVPKRVAPLGTEEDENADTTVPAPKMAAAWGQ